MDLVAQFLTFLEARKFKVLEDPVSYVHSLLPAMSTNGRRDKGGLWSLSLKKKKKKIHTHTHTHIYIY